MNNFTIINTVRHGETDYNRNKRYAGTIGVSLNEVGIRDTVQVSKRLKLLDMMFDQIITSTLYNVSELVIVRGVSQFNGHSEKLKGYIGNVQ